LVCLFVLFPATTRPNHQQKEDLERWDILMYIFARMISSIPIIVMEAWCRFDARKSTAMLSWRTIITSGN
jgi:hypothetical protein